MHRAVWIMRTNVAFTHTLRKVRVYVKVLQRLFINFRVENFPMHDIYVVMSQLRVFELIGKSD